MCSWYLPTSGIKHQWRFSAYRTHYLCTNKYNFGPRVIADNSGVSCRIYKIYVCCE